MGRLCILLFLFAGCTAPTAPGHLFSKYRMPAQEGCHLKRHHSANVYRTFHNEAALDDVWYDKEYALKRLEEHREAGDCP